MKISATRSKIANLKTRLFCYRKKPVMNFQMDEVILSPILLLPEVKSWSSEEEGWTLEGLISVSLCGLIDVIVDLILC